jgi:hypothetical protein
MFIEVRKIEMQFLKTSDGSVVKNPKTMEGVQSHPKIVTESVRVDEIKSFRSWGKSKDEENSIEGPISMIYFHDKGTSEKKGNPTMKINEHYEDFSSRLNVIKLPKK